MKKYFFYFTFLFFLITTCLSFTNPLFPKVIISDNNSNQVERKLLFCNLNSKKIYEFLVNESR